MQMYSTISRKLFHRYSNADVFTRANVNFLFIISAVFFTAMFLLFFVNVKKTGFFHSFISSGTSCITAMITMYLVIKGKVWVAGTFMTVVQAIILLLAGSGRTPEMALATSSFFCFPTIVLGVIYTRTWIHITLFIYLAGLLVINLLRFDPSAALHGADAARAVMVRGTITAIINLLMTYILANLTISSMRLALKISREETKKSNDKNIIITNVMETVKRSYEELTESIKSTGRAISNIFENIQTEAATIEELVASIEEISSSTTGIEQTIAEQNSSVNSLNDNIIRLSGMIDSLNGLGGSLQQEFGSISNTAELGNRSSKSLDEVNRKTMENSENMQSIADIIDDFFDRINLLSLNAAIEAARAGEHGRGFAVVADEISKLADNSSSELRKIKDLIDTNKSGVEFSNSIIGNIIKFIETLNRSLESVRSKAMDTLTVISEQQKLQGVMLNGTGEVQRNSEFIRNASAEQSIAIQEIAKSIENTNSLVQSNNSDAQILKGNYERLKTLAENLEKILYTGQQV